MLSLLTENCNFDIINQMFHYFNIQDKIEKGKKATHMDWTRTHCGIAVGTYKYTLNP